MAQNQAAQELLEHLQGRLVIVGIGNPMRGDDAAGPRLIERLGQINKEKAILVDAGPAPERHFGEVEAAAPESVLLVDAVDWGAEAGEIAFFTEDNLPQRASTTHDVALKLVMQYLRLQTGAKIGLVGIQPAQTAMGADMSASVLEAVDWLAQSLLNKIGGEVNLAGVDA